MSTDSPTTYWTLLRQRYLKNKGAKWSIRALLLLLLLAILGDFIAGEIPIYCKVDNKTHFPIFKKYAVDVGLTHWSPPFQNSNWSQIEYEKVIYPLIPYAATTMDKKNRHYKSPFSEQEIHPTKAYHWLGTDKLGHDVAAGMISGLRTALLVGLLSMFLASFIGLFLGGLAGYFGDDGLQVSIVRLLLNIFAFIIGIHVAFTARMYALTEGYFPLELIKSLFLLVVIVGGINLLAGLLERITFFSKSITFPMDVLIMRLVEIMNAIPGLLLILAVAMIIETPSIFTIIGIIGFTGWTGIARFVRAELLKIRNLEYIQAAKAMGFSHGRTLFRHAMPNALGPVLITIAFGIAGAILAEATLSFLGIGVPDDQITWGSLLRAARGRTDAWWLAVFPGLAIFGTVLLFNLIGEGVKEAIDSRE